MKHLQLINGQFDKAEALEILTQIIHAKIRFHENKILKSHNEEDIKMREKRIKQLQHDFHEAKQAIMRGDAKCELISEISIN